MQFFLVATLLFSATLATGSQVDDDYFRSQADAKDIKPEAMESLGFSLSQITGTNYGEATHYGQPTDTNQHGSCSYGTITQGEDGSTLYLRQDDPWPKLASTPWPGDQWTYIALNRPQFQGGAACGLCLGYQGTGGGIGTTPLQTTYTIAGFVDNECPECPKNNIDLFIDANGRWNVQWTATPCDVGTPDNVSPLFVTFKNNEYYWFNFVVANHRHLITEVHVQPLGPEKGWLQLPRGFNNMWAYYTTFGNGPFYFPMPVRIRSICGDWIETVIPTGDVGVRQSLGVQFPDRGPTYNDDGTCGDWVDPVAAQKVLAFAPSNGGASNPSPDQTNDNSGTDTKFVPNPNPSPPATSDTSQDSATQQASP